MTSFPMRREKLIKCIEKLLVSDCLRIKNYTSLFSGPYLLCIHPKAVEPLLEELHKGIYGSHIRGRSLNSIGGQTCTKRHKNT